MQYLFYLKSFAKMKSYQNPSNRSIMKGKSSKAQAFYFTQYFFKVYWHKIHSHTEHAYSIIT